MTAEQRRALRCAWLAAKLVSESTVNYPPYRERFGATERTYYRDLAVLAQAGVQFQSQRDHGRVLLTGLSL
jgi:predicted DNA-binding transcriptional regulator YafY